MALAAAERTMNRKQECIGTPSLASEIPEGTGKCIPAVEKHINTDRVACGPFRKRPPEKVTSETTVLLPPVDVNQLKSRLYVTASNQPLKANQNVLCFKRPTPSQIRSNALSHVLPLEPLVRRVLIL